MWVWDRSLAWSTGWNPAGGTNVYPVSVLCFQIEISSSGWSLFQRSPIDCAVSECDCVVWIMRGSWLTEGGGVVVPETNILFWMLWDGAGFVIRCSCLLSMYQTFEQICLALKLDNAWKQNGCCSRLYFMVASYYNGDGKENVSLFILWQFIVSVLTLYITVCHQSTCISFCIL